MSIVLTIISSITLVLLNVTSVTADTYYIVPTDSTPCPAESTTSSGSGSFLATPTDHVPLDENVTCLTLTHYAQLWSQQPVLPATNDSNTTLVFACGYHTLGSRLQIENLTNLVLQVEHTKSSLSFVTCKNSSGFDFVNISEVTVSGLEFSGCQENSVRSVNQLRMEECGFGDGHGVELRNVRNATFEGCSFTNLTAFTEVRHPLYNIYVPVGGAIAAFDNDMFDDNFTLGEKESCGTINVHSCDFNNNTAGNSGGAIGFWIGTISIHNSTFRNNFVGFYAGGAIGTWIGSISIHGSTFSNNTAHRFGGAIGSWGNIAVHGSNFSNNTAGVSGGAIGSGSSGIIRLYDSNFSGNKAQSSNGGAVCLLPGTSHNINIIINSTFSDNHAAERGGAIYVNSRILNFRGFLHIRNNSATTGVVFAQQSTLSISGNTTIFGNKASFYALDSNITFDGQTDFISNSHMHDTGVEEGGAVTALQSEIAFCGTVNITCNVQDYYGGAVLSSESKIYTRGNIIIAHNSARSGGGIYAYQSELNFGGSRTILSENNGTEKGGGIYAVGSTIKLTGGQLKFIENRAKKGGGICLEQNTKLYVIKNVAYVRDPDADTKFCAIILYGTGVVGHTCGYDRPGPILNYTNNSADYGGALYISDETNSGICSPKTGSISFGSNECFFQNLALHEYYDHNASLVLLETFFLNNSANISGGTIFGGLLDRCIVSPYAEVFNKYDSENTTTLDAISYLTNITNLQRNDIQSEISSKPVRVCFCTNGQPDCDSPPPSYEVNKGEVFSISLVAVDQVRNPLPSSVRAVLSSNLGGLADGQIIQSTTSNCTDLNFTITSPSDSEMLILYAEGPCSNIGISKTRVNVTFLPCNCPIGFIRTAETSNCNCQCDPCLSESITGCSFAYSSVKRSSNVWIAYINETNYNGFEGDDENSCPYLTYPYCPFDYCHPSSSPVWINFNTPNGSDAQCSFNRTGKLCGSCKDGLSLTLGSSHCRPCSNSWLALLIVFAIAGVALVTFLLVFNMTVAVGTINGLIFYANIIGLNRTVFFPFQSPNILTVFIAWFNLDFGFVTCFYDGMDGYAKEWLGFAFPVYIIFMVTMVIIGCEYSTRIARLFTHTNPAATLATLILLSFTKFARLRVIINSLSPITLTYPDGSREVVWFVDGNVQYFKRKHIGLFLVALLVLLFAIAYSTLLFSYHWLLHSKLSNWRAMKWIKNARFYPFMDAYLAPFNLKRRYWTGLLLFVRSFVYSIAAFNIGGDPNNDLLLIICTMIFLLLLSLPSRIYKSWPLDVLENSIIVNITILSVASLYIRGGTYGVENRQVALSYTSSGIAFVTFLAILIYHTFAFALPKKVRKKLNFFKSKLKQLFTKEEQHDPEIIHIPRNVVTYSVVDAIPSINEPLLNQSERETATKAKLSSLSDSFVDINPTADDSTSVASEQIFTPEKETGVEARKDKDGKGAVNIELEPRSPTFSDISLNFYIRDSDELGIERETEINNFIEVTSQ